MKWVVVVAIVVATACGRRDAEVARMQKQIDDLTAEVARLKQEAAQHQPAEAPVPEAPSIAASIPACHDYIAAVEAYLACDKVPPAAREATRNAMTQMRSAWHADMPDDARAAAANACATATQALLDGAAAIGCPRHAERGP